MISETVKEIRRKNFLNQTAFANKIGVTQGTVSQWENGLTRPNSEQLKAISEAFGVSVDELLAGDYQKPKQDNSPRTTEAQILATGIDKLPKEQREQALAVVRAMFAQYQDYFDKGTADEAES